MTELWLSNLPQAPLGGGPVLCMNIAGTVLTANHWGPHPHGFAGIPYNDRILFVHPGVPGWFDELDDVYTHCAWISSLGERCAGFAHSAALTRAAAWPYLAAPSPRDPRRWSRLRAVTAWIDPDAPVAVVDEHMAPQLQVCPQDSGYVPVYPPVRDTVPLFLRRPGPTLLVAPALHIGLSRRIVDLLCRFAHDPVAPEFNVRGVRRMHVDLAQRWPDPLPPGLEEPERHPLLESTQ